MYRVSYTQGNGYKCSCCRQTWEGTHDLKTEKEVIDYLVDKLYAKENPSEHGDEDDWDLDEVREIKDEDLTNKFYEIANELHLNKNTVKARKYKLEQIKNKLTEDEKH